MAARKNRGIPAGYDTHFHVFSAKQKIALKLLSRPVFFLPPSKTCARNTVTTSIVLATRLLYSTAVLRASDSPPAGAPCRRARDSRWRRSRAEIHPPRCSQDTCLRNNIDRNKTAVTNNILRTQHKCTYNHGFLLLVDAGGDDVLGSRNATSTNQFLEHGVPGGGTPRLTRLPTKHRRGLLEIHITRINRC